MTDTDAPRPPVVVGVDGSDHSLVAVDLAAAEAAARQLPLEIVHAFVLPVVSRPVAAGPDLVPLAPLTEIDEPALREHAEQVLSGAASRVRAAHPELPMVSRLKDGYPGEVLTDVARHAAMVVVGHRGMGGFAELVTGSVGVQLANHAAAPVVVVRGEGDRSGPVVVGVDGSEGSQVAAQFAIETAAAHQAPVIVLYAWPVDGAWLPQLVQAGEPPPHVPDEVSAHLTSLTRRYPQVEVMPEVRQQVSAHEALVAASKNARMVVVGSRGRGGFRGLLLGSVSQALINHAHCPVAVLRSSAPPD